MPNSLHALDVLIVVVYLALLAGIGIYFSRRQTNLESFFVSRGSFGWLTVGLSLMAALNSGLDYLMQPSSTIRYGLILLVGPLSWLFLYPWVSRVTLPFYRRLNFYTAYEFLEGRFDVRVRTLAAAIFIVWRLGWMATALYVPCLAINAVFGGVADLSTLIVFLGVLVTLYTMLGGIQAVVWNDVMQFVIMFGGLAATVWISVRGAGGFTPIVAAAGQAGHTSTAALTAGGGVIDRIQAFFTQPINGAAVLIATVLGRMAGFTSDQVMVQRFQTTTSVREARWAFIVNAVSDALWMIGLSLVGLALLAYFQLHTLPADYSTDKILPYFMSLAFPAGATGLVIAAILAASLSSIDSAVNSSTSVVVIDFYRRLVLGARGRGDDGTGAGEARRQLMVSRIATVMFGLTGTYLATNVARIGGLLEIANKLINAFTGPLFGIYVLAMFSRRATSGPVLVAGVVGSFTTYYVAYHTPIGFMWPSTFGFVATMAVGVVASAIGRTRPTEDAMRFTWAGVMKSEPR
jgi:SSS family transporter